MKTILLCALLLLVCQASSTFFPETSSPVLLWSNSKIFSSNSLQYLEKTDSKDVVAFINTLQAKGQPKLNIVSENYPKPEIIVVFVVDAQELHSARLSKFEKIITSAETSVIIPYNYQSKYRSTSQDLLHTMSLSKKVIISQSNIEGEASNLNRKYVATSQLVNFLGSDEEKQYIFDRKSSPELVVVYLDDVKDPQLFIQSINQRASELTSGNFVGVLFADEKIEHIHETVEAVHYQIAVVQRQVVADDSYFPTAVWEGILVSIVLLFLLLIGVGCTASVQTPKRWGTGKYVCQFTEIPDP